MWDFDKYKSNICLKDEYGVALTYGDIDKVCKCFADISPRSLVFVLCSNSIGSVVGYVSFIQNGIVPLLLNSEIEESLLKNLLELYSPNYLWMPDSLVEKTKNIETETTLSMYGYSLIKLSDFSHNIHPDIALLLTTSGSTGSPKFVKQSYNNIKINAEQIRSYLNITSNEKPITTLPMNYTYGLSIINSHLLSGATILLTDKTLMQREFWNFFKSSEATSFGGVPYTYEILDKLRFMRMELPSLRYMTQAGGKLSPELHKKFAEYAEATGKEFIVMYGQCEATARMAYLPAKDSLRKYGYMGIAIPGGRFELIDINGNVINEPNVSGELIYYGDNVTFGYAEKPEDLVCGDERHGRLETGDMAIFDEEGYYKIVGRKKRFLKVYGNRVNLDELDTIIKEKYTTIESVCAGCDDNVVIYIVGDNQDKSFDDEICRFLSIKTGLNHKAFSVKKIKEIPRNDSGKILYKELEKNELQ